MIHRSYARVMLLLAFVALLSACIGNGGASTAIITTPRPATMTSTPPLNATAFAATGVSAVREESRVPFPAPASCAAAAMRGPEKRRDFPAYWYDGNGIAVGNATAVFYAHGNKVMWQVQDDARLTITGERIDAAAPPMMVQNLGLTSGGYISGVVFALPGCWHLRAVAGTETLDAIFYVYPSGCIPSNMRDPMPGATPTPCVAPQESAAACPLTQPPDPALIPPPSVASTRLTAAEFWYGNDALWLGLPMSGVMWSRKVMWWRTATGQLTIEGKRLDGPAPPLSATISSGYGDTGFQASGLNFPTTGCWEVTGQVAGKELHFVVTVVPPPR